MFFAIHGGALRESLQVMVNNEAVRWAYRLFLDRDAESETVIAQKVAACSSTQELRRAFLDSDEFRQKNDFVQVARLAGDEPPLAIERVPAGPDLDRLFRHIQQTWQSLGETEPYWSVLSHESFLAEKVRGERVDHFYGTGEAEVQHLRKYLRRAGVDLSRFRVCLEYGCGVGRVTQALARAFEHVHAYDVSASHLALAESALRRYQVQNVSLHRVRSPADLDSLAGVDFVYSIIVLQHNPPPLIARILDRLLAALNPGGVAMFQVPTYRHGYSFELGAYLAASSQTQEIEMHVLPQAEIFRIAADRGVQIVDVLEDGRVGTAFRGLSNTFLVRKPG